MSEKIIAVASDGNNVSSHFGRCEKYILYIVENGEVVEKKELLNPGHQPGLLPEFLKKNSVNVLIAGGAGPKAIHLLESFNIKCILGVSGDSDSVIRQYLKGELKQGESSCEH